MTMEFDDRDRESVIRDLQNSEAEIRRLAVERVSALPISEVIPCLISSLGDSSWRVRKAAVERLVAHGEADDVADALIDSLGDGENTGRRNAAVDAIIQCGQRVLPKLIEARFSEDDDVRKLLVDTLAGIGGSDTREPLMDLLEDSDANVRAAAADALGAIGGDQVAEALLNVATRDGEDQLVRFSAVRALAALEVPVRASAIGALLDDPVLGSVSLGLLGCCDDDEEAIAVLLKALASRSRNIREGSMRSLLRVVGRVDPDQAESVVEQIRTVAASSDHLVTSAIERLFDAEEATRLVLIQFLGICAVREAVIPILIASSNDSLCQVAVATLESLGEAAEERIDSAWMELNVESRRAACLLFGRIKGERSDARLFSALEDVAYEVRVAAAQAISDRGLSSGLALLVQRLVIAAADDDVEGEEELEAISGALIALAKPKSGSDPAVTERAIELLTACLDGAVENVRLAVANVLGRVGRHADAEIVAFLLKDPSSKVRRAAVKALARLEPGTAAEPLRLALGDESPSVRIAAANALSASESDRVVHDLMQLSTDSDSRVRSAAARSIVLRFKRGIEADTHEIATGVLDQALADEAPVALAAVGALCEVGGPAVDHAVSVLSRPEPELVREAIRCIATHVELAAVEVLLPLVSHPDWSVRAEAIRLVGERGLLRGVPVILRHLETESDDFVRDVSLCALKRLEGEVR